MFHSAHVPPDIPQPGTEDPLQVSPSILESPNSYLRSALSPMSSWAPPLAPMPASLTPVASLCLFRWSHLQHLLLTYQNPPSCIPDRHPAHPHSCLPTHTPTDLSAHLSTVYP